MGNLYGRRAHSGAVTVLAVCVGFATARVYADELTLADLLADPGASIVSEDGLFEFSGFAYKPTLGAPAAPEPASIRVVTDEAAADGFRLEGPLQVHNGVDMSITLDFKATSLTGLGFNRAAMTLLAPTAFDPAFDQRGEDDTSVLLAETVMPLHGGSQRRFETYLHADGSGVKTAWVELDPKTFGSSIRVSQEISLNSTADGTGSVAGLSSYKPGFSVVPEPMTLVLMLVAAPAVGLRWRHRRVR